VCLEACYHAAFSRLFIISGYDLQQSTATRIFDHVSMI